MKKLVKIYYSIWLISLFSVSVAYIWEKEPYVITETLSKVFLTLCCLSPFAIYYDLSQENKSV